jgi:hypothetical protein
MIPSRVVQRKRALKVMKGTQAKASPYMMISLEASGDTEVHIWTPPPCAQGEEALRGNGRSVETPPNIRCDDNTNKERVDRAEVTRKDTHVTEEAKHQGHNKSKIRQSLAR